MFDKDGSGLISTTGNLDDWENVVGSDNRSRWKWRWVVSYEEFKDRMIKMAESELATNK